MRKLLLLILSTSLLLVSCRSYQAQRLASEGYEQLMARDFSSAGASFAKASEKDVDNHTYRYNYLLSLFLEGDYERVVKLSEEAFGEFDFNLSFLLLKAQAYREQSQYKQALETYERLFAIDPGSYETQAEVMEASLSWNEKAIAQRLALGLLTVKGYEKRSLTVLSQLAGEESWYAHALAFVMKEGQTEGRQ
ncbi:MAG: hypothetical protein GX626_03515 [Spirochaetales bacterium]|jgi:tetratricopeptide (TPR) repeat protein|nr:hypothetical protein [Spirochaetales bacterium]